MGGVRYVVPLLRISRATGEIGVTSGCQEFPKHAWSQTGKHGCVSTRLMLGSDSFLQGGLACLNSALLSVELIFLPSNQFWSLCAALLLLSSSSNLSVPPLDGASKEMSRVEWSKCSRRLISSEFISITFGGCSFYSGQLTSGTHCCVIPLWVRINVILGCIRHPGNQSSSVKVYKTSCCRV